MRLCYQVATPDVAIADSVTAYQGPLENSFAQLSKLGYDGVEFMTLNPKQLDWDEIKKLSEQYKMAVDLVCTGEIFGQLGLNYTDPDPEIRKKAIEASKDIIDFAEFFNAKVNIGRVRGQYCKALTKEQTEQLAEDAFRELAEYAGPKNVRIALETVTIMQTNFINTMAEGVAMVDRVNLPNFRMMMDVFHLNLEEKDLFEAIRKYADYCIHVHLADNNRRYPGQCGLDFEKIIRTFKEHGYNETFTTEIFQLPDMQTAAEESAKYLIPILNKVYEA